MIKYRISMKRLELMVAQNREELVFHQDPLAEWELFHQVKNGNTARVSQAWGVVARKLGTLSRKSPLRNMKNLAICGITLATRAAIEGGLFWEEAYTLSDLYIQSIEDLHDVEEVNAAFQEALLDFTERVERSKRDHVSMPVAKCQNYIFNHLYEDLRLNQLAELVNLAPAYLSTLFKRETGITISQYIQRERIEEAKRLLMLTDSTIAEISSRLNFYDQTYFGKVFKKHTGMTPNRYRQTYQLYHV